MKKYMTVWSLIRIIEATLLVALGIITTVFANNTTYRIVIVVVAASLILLDGILRLTLYFTSPRIDDNKVALIAGAFELTFGIWLIILSKFVVDYVILFISIAILVAGVILLADGIIKIIRKSQKMLLTIFEFIGASIGISLGIVALVFFPYNNVSSGANTINVMLVCSGVLLAALGIFIIGFTVANLIQSKRHHDSVIEATVVKHAKERHNQQD